MSVPTNNVSQQVATKERPKTSPPSITIRDYNPAISFFPLFIFSGLAWLLEHFWGPSLTGSPGNWLQIIWVAIFFLNLVVVLFNFPTTKVIGLFLVIALVIIVLVLLVNFHVFPLNLSAIGLDLENLNFGFNEIFYAFMFCTFGLVLLVVILGSRVNYVTIEQNEVLFKHIFGDEKRYPTGQLKYTKKIIDVFEYTMFGAGSLTLQFPGELPITFDLVPRIHKKAEKIDDMLSYIEVSPR